MKQEINYIDQEIFDISIEEFDALTGVHEFSPKYEKQKREMMKAYRKSFNRTGKERFSGNFRKIAVAAACVVLFTPFIVKAAGSDFISRIWGAAGRENINAHEETVFEADKDQAYTVTYPKREYEDMESGRAEELVGDSISYKSVVKEMGDTRLTILAAVNDGNASVVEFTLEREGGVEALGYSQLNNESKGAWFTETSPFYFHFADCNENIFVDLEKSTKDMLYCYDYMVVEAGKQVTDKLILETEQYSDADENGKTEVIRDTLFIPLRSEVKKSEFVNVQGGIAEISPMSMKIDMNTGLGFTREEAYDPWNVYYVSVNYKDGTSYVIHEHGIEGVHSCEVETDNSSYICGNLENEMVFVFNRLVDTEKVDTITVNETVYTLK